ncbi:MAG: hypothetical protein L0922_03345, partial [Candidatus Mariimomonas ferrooxydans]
MELTDWINSSLPEVVIKIEESFEKELAVNTEEGINVAGRHAVYNVINTLLGVLFPDAPHYL